MVLGLLYLLVVLSYKSVLRLRLLLENPMRLFWFLPTAGDGRHLASARGARAVDYDYLRQIAQAADRLGYYGVLLPIGRVNEETWLVASSLIAATRRLRFIVATRPGL